MRDRIRIRRRIELFRPANYSSRDPVGRAVRQVPRVTIGADAEIDFHSVGTVRPGTEGVDD